MRGDNIRKIRESKGWSMDYVRELTGLSKSTISDSENVNGNPTEKTLEKLAKVYGVDIKEFYKDADSESDLGELEQSFPEGVYVLRRANKKLTPEAREQMLKIMKTFFDEEDDEDE